MDISFTETGAKVRKSGGIDVGENERELAEMVERKLMSRLETLSEKYVANSSGNEEKDFVEGRDHRGLR